MHDEYLTAGEVALLAAVFIGPFLVVGGLVQVRALRRAHLSWRVVASIIVTAAVVTLALPWLLLLSGLPQFAAVSMALEHGGALALPGAVAAAVVTLGVVKFARFRVAAGAER